MRQATDGAGNYVESALDYPFGQQWVNNGNAWDQNFAGMPDRAIDLDLYLTGSRQLGIRLSRWLSPDWSAAPRAIPYADLTDPQSLNRYSYVGNNPLSHADTNGHQKNWDFFKAELRGVWKATGGGVVSLGRSIASGEARANIATTLSLAVHNPGAIVAAGKEAASQISNTVSQAAKGNPEAIGAVVGAGAMLAAPFAKSAVPSTPTTTVTHFTNDAGMQAISKSGTLNAGSYVTTSNAIPAGATSAQIESTLEIGAGKGANSITFETPNSNLTIPEGGPTTSGGAPQFQLNNPTPIDPTKFKSNQ